MVDKEKSVSPEETGIDRRSTTPVDVVGEAGFLFTQQVFEISQTLGRVMERLDTHSEKLDRMEQAVGQLTEKVDGISQDFRIIKHFWWICLVAAGALLKAGYDAFIKPVVG